MNRHLLTVGFSFASAFVGMAYGIDSQSAPRPIPLTRPEMKQYLEDMKARKPRIPLPELTAEDKEKLGERGMGYEGRLRYHYLNVAGAQQAGGGGGGGQGRAGGGGGAGGFGGRDNDPDMTLDNKFKVQLFWIVSRTNNCQYCLGHQESKLLAAGMVEDEIAALDSDWSLFTPAEQAAFAFARKYTFEPNKFSDADIVALRSHFNDSQILEMILSMAWNNSINRWKEGAGIPQSPNGGGFGRRPAEGNQPGATAARPEVPETYLTPTHERYQSKLTNVAPLIFDTKSNEATRKTICTRPPLESRAEVEQALVAAHQRTPRLPISDVAKTREVLPDDWNPSLVPQWARLLANFPKSAKGRIASIRTAEEKSELSPLLKAQVSWIIARQDRAWYATGLAKQRLRELGQTDDQIYQLDGDWKEFSPTERSLFTVAKQLSATPVVLTDDEVDAAVKLAGPRDVVQLISYVTNRASFDRITESAGLALED